MKLALVLIHGIGGSNESWAEPVVKKLQSQTLAKLKAILKDKPPKDISQVLAIKSVYWKTALEKPQNELQKILGRYFKWVVGGLGPWNIFKGLWKGFYQFQSKFTAQFIGDIIGYLSKDGKMGVVEKIHAALEALGAETPDQNIPLTFISHSLGTVIASNYIFDRMEKHRMDAVNRMDERFIFFNMFTAGSPIALFSMKFSGPESFNRPVEVEDLRGRWINFLDKDDPIAMPLKVLNANYDKAVHSDYQVDSGPFGLAHTAYFDKTNMLDLIAQKLAIDWVSLNHLIPEAEISDLYAAYDKTLTVVE